MIFVGCASRSPSAYERGINYPGASVWSLLRPLAASLSLFATHRSLSLSLSLSRSVPFRPTISFRLLRQSLPVVVRSSLSVSLSPTARVVYNDSSWWDDTGSEVRTAEPRRSLNGKFELRRHGLLQGGYTRSLSRVREGKSASFDRRARSAFA